MGQAYPGPAIVAKNRPDLAGLPFRFGVEAVLFKTRAENLDALSKQLRSAIQKCIPPDGTDPRPDPDKLYEMLLAGPSGQFREGKWAVPEAVPCIQQILQAEGAEIRRMSVELLRGLSTPAATEALVRWAVFDVEPENRAAAVDALKARDREAVTELLLRHLRYPWPRAVEHAAEALVELECRSAVPELAALLQLPPPEAPFETDGGSGWFRREMVRINHFRNCLMCHIPSMAPSDLVRGAVPDPSRPLPSPVTPAYYNEGQRFVSAATTYLKQDFSVVQPVAAHGNWPAQQRYDYLVAVRRANKDEADPTTAAEYHNALLFALRELSGQDLGNTPGAWARLQTHTSRATKQSNHNVASFLALLTHPEPLLQLHLEFSEVLLTLTPANRNVLLAGLRRKYGEEATRQALNAFLTSAASSEDSRLRELARQRLDEFRTSSRRPEGVSHATPTEDSAAVARLLGHAHPLVRVEAVNWIPTLGPAARQWVNELVKALRDEHAAVRRAAAEVLGTLRVYDEEAILALATATKDTDPGVCQACVRALTGLGVPLPAKSARPLIESLLQPTSWARAEERSAFEKELVSLLEAMGPRLKSCYPLLLQATKDRKPTDAKAPMMARLMRAAGPPPQELLADLIPLLREPPYQAVAASLLYQAGEDGIPVLLAALKHEAPEIRATAAECLAQAASLNRNPPISRTRWREASDALAMLKAKDPSPVVRQAAATALQSLIK